MMVTQLEPKKANECFGIAAQTNSGSRFVQHSAPDGGWMRHVQSTIESTITDLGQNLLYLKTKNVWFTEHVCHSVDENRPNLHMQRTFIVKTLPNIDYR